MSNITTFPLTEELDVEHLAEPALYVYQEVPEGPEGECVFIHVGFAYEIQNEDTGEMGLLVKHHPDAPRGEGETVFFLTPTRQEEGWTVFPPQQRS